MVFNKNFIISKAQKYLEVSFFAFSQSVLKLTRVLKLHLSIILIGQDWALPHYQHDTWWSSLMKSCQTDRLEEEVLLNILHIHRPDLTSKLEGCSIDDRLHRFKLITDS